MPNSILTIDMITREAIMLFRNSNAFIQNLDRQYDDSFANDGAKIGFNLRIRLPNDYTVRTGAAMSVQDTAEQSTTLVVSTQKGVDVGFSTAERTMQLDDYSERVLAPMINNLAGDVAMTIMRGVEGGVSNYVSTVDGAGAIATPTSRTVLESGALLTKRSAPNAGRNLVADPYTMAHFVETMQGLFNPSTTISKQFDTATIYKALNYRWFEDQSILVHTTGTFSAGTVNGAGQTGTNLVTNAITGTLKAGDIINITGVNSVNRVNKSDDGMLQQFVVTANVANGATAIPIYPAIIGPAADGSAVQYQTCTASPANGAAVSLVNQASEIYRKNVAYAPGAITMVTADLLVPKKVEEAARERFDGLSMRMITAYLPGTDELVTRLDILFGYLFIRPEWCVAIPDTV
jgi:hypothetical protein